MAQPTKSLSEQLQSITEYQTACARLQEVKKLLPKSNPALRVPIKALVAGFENWLADPITPISKVPPRIKIHPDGSHTVEPTESRITPHGFVWMADIWLRSTKNWIEEQTRQKKREKKAKARLSVLRQAKASLSTGLYVAAHGYHNFVTGKRCPDNPRSVEEVLLNTEQFLAETEKHIIEVARIERQYNSQPATGVRPLGKAA